MEHHIQRCPLFTYKQYLLAPGYKVCNKIGNGLAFPGTRRSLDNITFAFPRLQDGFGLCWVCLYNMEPFCFRKGC